MQREPKQVTFTNGSSITESVTRGEVRMEREPGFYWVRYYGSWRPASMDEKGRFEVLGWSFAKFEEAFEEIGPRITPPEEK